MAAAMLQSTIMVAPVSSGIMQSFESVGKGTNIETSRNRQKRLNYAAPRREKTQTARKDRKVIYNVLKGSVTIDDQLTTASKEKLNSEETAPN